MVWPSMLDFSFTIKLLSQIFSLHPSCDASYSVSYSYDGYKWTPGLFLFSFP